MCIGYFSDLLTAPYGEESLRYAFCSTFITGGISMVLFYLASRSYPKEALTHQAIAKKEEDSLADMSPVLNIVFGVFLLFVVGLFFLQMGLAGVKVLTLATWILALVALFFTGGIYYTTKGIINGK